MKTNTVRIDIDKNPESGKVINTDLLSDFAGPAFDWRLLTYDGDNYYDEILEAIHVKLQDQADDIARACNVDAVYIDTDIVDAFDFVFIVRDQAEPNTDLVMISYVVDDSTFLHD